MTTLALSAVFSSTGVTVLLTQSSRSIEPGPRVLAICAGTSAWAKRRASVPPTVPVPMMAYDISWSFFLLSGASRSALGGGLEEGAQGSPVFRRDVGSGLVEGFALDFDLHLLADHETTRF